MKSTQGKESEPNKDLEQFIIWGPQATPVPEFFKSNAYYLLASVFCGLLFNPV